MSNNKVEVSARADLVKIIADLDNLRDSMLKVSKTFDDAGKDTGNTLRDQTKKTETYLGKMGNMGRNVLDRLKDDFKSLLSVNALAGGLKISESFKNSIKEAVTLSDTIRKLGPIFGISASKFANFQGQMMKGLGELGLGSDAAANALEGLSETQVRGEASLIEYSKQSGMLASIGGEKGREGEISRGMANVIRERGGNVENIEELRSISEDLRRIYLSTGKGPTESLQAMQEIMKKMPDDLRKNLTTKTVRDLGVMSAVAGPDATKFLEEYLGKSKNGRIPFEAQGFKNIMGPKGINLENFQKGMKEILGRVKGDKRLAASTLGISDEAAEGLVRLNERFGELTKTLEKTDSMVGDTTESYKQNRTLGEAWNANLNKIKKQFAEPIGAATQGMTDILNQTSESAIGSAGMVLGGGVLSALLTGQGLRGIGSTMTSGFREKLAEQRTGEKTTHVWVDNPEEIKSDSGGLTDTLLKGGGFGSILQKGFGMITKALPWVAGATVATGAGVMIGNMINEDLDKFSQGKTSEGFEGNVVERLFFKLDKLFGGEASTTFMKNQNVLVEINDKQLKKVTQPTRSASQ